MTKYYIGLDGGSTYLKAALIGNGRVIDTMVRNTGFDNDGTARKIAKELCERNSLMPSDIGYIMATGDSRKITVSLSLEKDKAVISVKDYGKGIPENELENIWDRYYTTRMRKGKGVSGLGLAIVRQITELHKGTCHARSQTGKGSVFTIELPC